MKRPLKSRIQLWMRLVEVRVYGRNCTYGNCICYQSMHIYEQSEHWAAPDLSCSKSWVFNKYMNRFWLKIKTGCWRCHKNYERTDWVPLGAVLPKNTSSPMICQNRKAIIYALAHSASQRISEYFCNWKFTTLLYCYFVCKTFHSKLVL